jgi:hypothetical protein
MRRRSGRCWHGWRGERSDVMLAISRTAGHPHVEGWGPRQIHHHSRRAPRRVEACQARAAERAAKLAPIITEIKAAGITRLSGIAAALNARGVLRPAGRRYWSSSQIGHLLRRLEGCPAAYPARAAGAAPLSRNDPQGFLVIA